MRQLDDGLIDPEIAEMLDAIDATLAGDPVDPEFAEVAELALLLSTRAPRPSPGFASELDHLVERRFARGPDRGASAVPRGRRRFLSPASGLAAAGALATVVVVALSSGGGSTPGLRNTRSEPASAAGTAQTLASAARGAAAARGAGADGGAVLQPPANGRKIIQSAQLSLGVGPDRIDDVAQQVFVVVGSFNGIVDRSSVTATGGPDGNAQFQLRVPSSSLPQTMSALSRLKFAHVISRTDNSQDVNGQFADANQQLASASALRTDLLKQLGNATTQQQMDSIKAQISDAQATITRVQGTLRTLNHRVDLSQITLSVQASTGTVPVSGGGGFTIYKAAHDAVRVLAVAAGVALIVLAALVPLSLLAAPAWWLWRVTRRRRREQALDMA